MSACKIAYLELPARDVAGMKTFYGGLFGWSFEDFGPDYAAFHDSGLEGGFNGSNEGRPSAPLAVLQTDEIETMEARVRDSGGKITAPVFAYPGGRRFHFTDPDGNELAVMQPD